jgi:hypothetical protein
MTSGCALACLAALSAACGSTPQPSGSSGSTGTGSNAELASILRGVGALRDGGATDIDGDGLPDLFTGFDGGTKITTGQLPSGGTITLVDDGSGNVRLTADFDRDGKLDFDLTVTKQVARATKWSFRTSIPAAPRTSESHKPSTMTLG